MGFFDRFKENLNKQTKKSTQDSLAADSLEEGLEILATPSTFWEAVGALRISIEHKGDDPDEVRRFRQFFAGMAPHHCHVSKRNDARADFIYKYQL